MFYRAARIAERKSQKRQAAQTWREWILGLPDSNGRSILTEALEIFEKANTGGCRFQQEILRYSKKQFAGCGPPADRPPSGGNS